MNNQISENKPKGSWKLIQHGSFRNGRKYKRIWVPDGVKFYPGSHCHASIGTLMKDLKSENLKDVIKQCEEIDKKSVPAFTPNSEKTINCPN